MPNTAAVTTSNFRPARALSNPRLAALPKEAREKFEHLRRIEARAAALRDGLLDQRHSTRAELDDAVRKLGHFDREHQPENSFTYEEAKDGTRRRVAAVFPERLKLVAQIGTLREELSRLDTEIATTNVGFTTGAIIDWLNRDVPTTARFAAISNPKFVVNKGETLADALAQNRQEQATVSEQIAELEAAHITISEAQARMRADVNALAERGRPDVAGVLFGGNVTWPTKPLVAEVRNEQAHLAVATVEDTLAVVVWANREAIIAKLSAEIEATGDDATAVSATDRPRLIAQKQAVLLTLQHIAEAIICRMEATGQFITRTCTNPLVLLAVDDGTLGTRVH